MMRTLSILASSALTVVLAVACGDSASTPPKAVTCESTTCSADRICVIDDAGAPRCVCPPDATDTGDACVLPRFCTPDSCSGRGTCFDDDGSISCVCDDGFGGIACEGCADGFHEDGAGECTTDPCVPDPCAFDKRCVVEDSGEVECLCPVGEHDEGGACVPDTTCLEDTCGGHGSCSDADDSIVCTCDEGWSGAYCTECDERAGYHEDGDGGCTTDACLPNPCAASNRSVCSHDGLETTCSCDPGYHETPGGECVANQQCAAENCGEHGSCHDTSGAIVCACDTGWAGEECTSCDAAGGYHDDGTGGCTTDPCRPNPCDLPNRRVCTPDTEGNATCACDAGHNEDTHGECVADQACTAASCNRHGTCDDSTLVVVCTCLDGWAGTYCEVCDETEGYHDDGTGGCTTEPCLPNPCVEANRGVCSPDGDGMTCDCDAGYHDDGGGCVQDTRCTPSSCNGHGSCDDSGGFPVCTCNTGWSDLHCDACDTAAGFHDDGMGGCTTDPCLPNPCTAPNQTLCVATGPNTSCECVAGFHDDGTGGCTTDPCLPDPCAASNQLCRDNGGVAECYTPTCSDDNPCTDDSFDGSKCVFDALIDGAACSTTLCTEGQTCTDGDCGGGTPTNCADTNPCTADSCDDLTGCSNDDDDTLVPDDGFDCTADTCSAGVESHVADDSVCNAGGWCSGTGVCSPAAPGADARGCLVDNVPQPPAPDGPCGVWDCDDVAEDFTLVSEPPGTPCDDRVACTSSDVCSGTGECRGTVTSACAPGAPCSPEALGPETFDIPMARVVGDITLDGAPLVSSSESESVLIYLRSKSTGSLHRLEGVAFSSWDGSGYPLYTGNERFDGLVDNAILPGVYDVIYRRTYGSDPMDFYGGDSDDVYPFGNTVLLEDVVFGPGTNLLDVDVPTTRVTGAITLAGGPLVSSSEGETILIYLRSKSTGSLHRLEGVSFSSWDGSGYPVYTGNERFDGTIDNAVIPGTYDVIYRRTYGSDPMDFYGGDSDDPYPFGNIGLMEDVVLGPGSATLDVDIPSARVTGAITLAGGPLTASTESQTGLIYLRNESTGSMHRLEGISFSSWDGSGYPLYIGNPRFDGVIDNMVVPGTYDVIYRRTYGGDPMMFYGGDSDDPYPFGNTVLMEKVVIGPGPTTLDVDIPAVRVTGDITLDGGPLVSSTEGQTILFYLRSQSTGSLHRLEGVSFGSWDGSGYPLYTGNPRYDGAIDNRVVPGTYDLVYRRTYGSDSMVFYGGNSNDAYPFGNTVLRSGVVIGPGPTTLDIDIPTSRVTGSVSLGGGPLVSSQEGETILFYLRSESTGSLHRLEGVSFSSWDGSGYPIYTNNARFDGVIDNEVIPGTYDLIYRRTYGSDPMVFYGGDSDDSYPFGNTVLMEDVAVVAGATTLNIDIPATRLTSPVTLGGGPLTSSQEGETALFYLQSQSTGSLHRIEGVSFSSWDGSGYPVYTGNQRFDGAVDNNVIPGDYDVIYRRTYGSDPMVFYGGDSDDLYPFGNNLLRRCVIVP